MFWLDTELKRGSFITAFQSVATKETSEGSFFFFLTLLYFLTSLNFCTSMHTTKSIQYSAFMLLENKLLNFRIENIICHYSQCFFYKIMYWVRESVPLHVTKSNISYSCWWYIWVLSYWTYLIQNQILSLGNFVDLF